MGRERPKGLLQCGEAGGWKTLGQIGESRDGGGREKEDMVPSSPSCVLQPLDVTLG